MDSSRKLKSKLHFSHLVQQNLRRLSPIQTIMKMTEDQSIWKMGGLCFSYDLLTYNHDRITKGIDRIIRYLKKGNN
jgi:hypothetical protein